MVFGELLLLTLSPVVTDGEQEQFHLSLTEREVLDTAIDGAAGWLLEQLDQGPAAGPAVGREPSRLLRTAMVLWTLAEARAPRLDVGRGFGLCGVLLEQRRTDGGIFHPGSGLETYESMLAERALDAFQRYYPQTGLEQTLRPLREANAVYRASEHDEAPPLGGAIRELQQEAQGLSQEEREALRFLGRAGRERPEGIEGPRRLARRRPYIFEPPAPGDARSAQALELLRAQPTLGESLPALIAMFGEAALLPPEPELQFSNFAAALTLARAGQPTLSNADGTAVDWPRVLSRQTLGAQRPDGSWRSTGVSRQTDPLLVTCYAVHTLRLCRDVRAGGEAR